MAAWQTFLSTVIAVGSVFLLGGGVGGRFWVLPGLRLCYFNSLVFYYPIFGMNIQIIPATMDIQVSLVSLLLLLAVVGIAICSRQRFLSRRQFVRCHRCQPVARCSSKDPFIRLDMIPGAIRSKGTSISPARLAAVEAI